MTVFFIGWALISPLFRGRPALPMAQPAIAAAGLPAMRAGSPTVEVSPTVEAQTQTALARWDAPSKPQPTPQTQIGPTPASVRGPRLLALSTGDLITVQPATGEWANGAFRWAIPRDAAGWHTDSADCGQGVTVIGGHIKYDGLPGVFTSLASIGAQDTVTCTDANGQAHTFRPADYILAAGTDDPATWTPAWRPALLLYTCTPELNGQVIVIRLEEQEDVRYTKSQP